MEEIQEKLAQLQSAPVIDEAAITKLELALDALSNLADITAQTDALVEKIDSAPTERAEIEQRLAALQTEEIPVIGSKTSIDTLDVELANAKAKNAEIVEALADLSDYRQTLLVAQMELPDLIAKTGQEFKEHRILTAGTVETSAVDRWYSESIEKEKRARLSLYALQQDSMVQQLEMVKLEIQLNERELKQNDLIIESLQGVLLSASERSGQKTIRRAKKLAESLGEVPEAINQHATELIKYSEQYESLSTNIVKIRQDRQQLESIRQQTTQTLSLIKEHIKWLELSPAFSDAIRFQLRQLPKITTTTEAENIVAAHLQRFSLATLLASTPLPDESSNKLSAEYQLSETKQQALTKVLTMKSDLLDKLVSENDQYIAELTRLEALRELVIAEIATEKAYLREKQLFLQGRPPLWKIWPKSISELFGTVDISLRAKTIKNNLGLNINVVIAFIFTSLVVWFVSYKIKRLENYCRLSYYNDIGSVKRDRFRNTLTMILLAILFGAASVSWLLFPFFYATATKLLVDTNDLYHIATILLFGIAIWEVLIRLSNSKGVLISHFNFGQEAVNSLRQLLQRYRWGLYLLMVLVCGCEMFAEKTESTALRLSFILLAFWVALFYSGILRSTSIKRGLPLVLQSSTASYTLAMLLLVPQLVAISLAAIGYFYAAWLTAYYQQTIILLLLLGVFLQHVGYRWLRIQQRRLAYQRAKARLEELSTDSDTEIDDYELDVDEINDQSVLVLNVVVLLVMIALFSALSAKTQLAFQWMDSVVVWEVLALTGSAETVDPVTLREAFTALAFTAICLFAARNLPGILELLVLQHLNLSKGTAYATTSLLRYTLILIALVVGLSTLGLHWSKLQWLVAALGVGLGFGLQEIFANLVSGLILLFERPVRVGDTITINNLTGTVTRINTRATTIQDWDRKEILVPNKALITDQLINWSLSDAVTRLVIPIGVAYGSDVPNVKKQLIEVASNNEELLKEPSPIALFNGFGASSLDFELRVYLDHLDKLAVVRDQLNTAIESRFREQQIEIAFPQLDVRIKTQADDDPSDNQ